MGFKLVITDWSGVVSDDRYPVYEANARMMEGYGLKRVSFEEWLPLTQLSAASFFAQFDIAGDADAINGAYSAMYKQVRSEGIHPKAYADAQRFMSVMGLREKTLVVVSSHPHEHLRAEAREYGLEGHVSKFVGSAKDKALELRRVVSSHDFHPSQVIYLGDTVYDIKAAKEAGVASVGVATGYHTKERLRAEHPDLLVDSLTELIGRL